MTTTETFAYCDLHCHPNLKSFGHSFDRSPNGKSDVWHTKKPTTYSKLIHRFTGITKFSQSDFSTMSRAGAKVIFLSLYPFEKGFFINERIPPVLTALLADWGIEIGYRRIRYLQRHTSYYDDLLQEYQFVLDAKKSKDQHRWSLVSSYADIERFAKEPNHTAVILTIEGSHVFNTGLKDFGKAISENQVLQNIKLVKGWKYPPFFVGLAHNFNNDLCGHARSLQRLGSWVNQEKKINTGISPLGYKVIDVLLDRSNGKRIFIDLKHMSLQARKDYYQLLAESYKEEQISIVVSHGAVTGCRIEEKKTDTLFNTDDINFFDEEITIVAKSKGLFALQMDVNILCDRKKWKEHIKSSESMTPIQQAAEIVWQQLEHIAKVCDDNGLFAWDVACLGTDFDGSIYPFPGVLTASDIPALAYELIPFANKFLKEKTLTQSLNQKITGEEIVQRFMDQNVMQFLKTHYS